MLNQAKISRILGSEVRPLTPDAKAQLDAHKIIADTIGEYRGLDRFKGDMCDELTDLIFTALAEAGIAFAPEKPRRKGKK